MTYGTPGSVIDDVFAKEVKPFVTSCVLNSDLVCRLSLHSLLTIREQVLDAISRAKVSKMKIMQGMFTQLNVDELMYPPGQAPDRCIYMLYIS